MVLEDLQIWRESINSGQSLITNNITKKNLTFPRFRPVHPDVALGALVGSIPSFSFAETWD